MRPFILTAALFFSSSALASSGGNCLTGGSGTDADGDGACSLETGGADCDDTDADVSPLADERYDLIDNNCDGDVDEPSSSKTYGNLVYNATLHRYPSSYAIECGNNSICNVYWVGDNRFILYLGSITKVVEYSDDVEFIAVVGSKYSDVLDATTTTVPMMVWGNNGADIISTGSGDDVVYGGNGADDIGGGNGADTLYGESGRDYLEGSGGEDTLYGGDDEDLLVGGAGSDTLSGGKHADEFRLTSGDTMLDYSASEGDTYVK